MSREIITSIINQLNEMESILTKFVEYVTDEIWVDRLNKLIEYKSKLSSNLDDNEMVDVLLSTDALLKIIYADMYKIKMQHSVVMQ